MKTVHEMSKLSGLSVRALHHYDNIGLLKPAKMTEAGYRLYGEAEEKRLQMILMFRELGFPLSDIAKILDNPDFDLKAALREHIEMLRQERNHIDGLLKEAEKMLKGENAGFEAFDRSGMDEYRDEVKRKWGNTAAYGESEEKMAGKSDVEKKNMADGLMEKFVEFGKLKETAPDSRETQGMVKSLQDYISANYYTCTKEILSGLGEMYVGDERFRENIDRAGGKGTAEFVREAIRIYSA